MLHHVPAAVVHDHQHDIDTMFNAGQDLTRKHREPAIPADAYHRAISARLPCPDGNTHTATHGRQANHGPKLVGVVDAQVVERVRAVLTLIHHEERIREGLLEAGEHSSGLQRQVARVCPLRFDAANPASHRACVRDILRQLCRYLPQPLSGVANQRQTSRVVRTNRQRVSIDLDRLATAYERKRPAVCRIVTKARANNEQHIDPTFYVLLSRGMSPETDPP
jgi:hypothetical protein